MWYIYVNEHAIRLPMVYRFLVHDFSKEVLDRIRSKLDAYDDMRCSECGEAYGYIFVMANSEEQAMAFIMNEGKVLCGECMSHNIVEILDTGNHIDQLGKLINVEYIHEEDGKRRTVYVVPVLSE